MPFLYKLTIILTDIFVFCKTFFGKTARNSGQDATICTRKIGMVQEDVKLQRKSSLRLNVQDHSGSIGLTILILISPGLT